MLKYTFEKMPLLPFITNERLKDLSTGKNRHKLYSDANLKDRKMSDPLEDRQHAPIAEASKLNLDTLPTELVLKIYDALQGETNRQTTRNRTGLRLVAKRFDAMMADQDHALGRHEATLSAAAAASLKLHDLLYPKEGLSDESHNIQRVRRPPNAAEEIAMLGPVLDLLPEKIQTNIVMSIVGPECNLSTDNRARAVREMCGFLDKLHNRDDVEKIVDTSISYFTDRKNLYSSEQWEGAYGVVMAENHLSLEQDNRIDQAMMEEPALNALYAAAISIKAPEQLNHPDAVKAVVKQMPFMGRHDQMATTGELLKHLDMFSDEDRKKLVESAVMHLENYPSFPGDMIHEDHAIHYEVAKSVCTNLAQVKADLSETHIFRLDQMNSTHQDIGVLWARAGRSAAGLTKPRSTEASDISLQKPMQRLDATARLARPFETLKQKNLQDLTATEKIVMGTVIAHQIANEVEAAKNEVEVARREYDNRSRSDSGRSV